MRKTGRNPHPNLVPVPITRPPTPPSRKKKSTKRKKQAAAQNKNFGAHIVPANPVYTPYQDILQNANMGFPTNDFIPQELGSMQNIHMGLPEQPHGPPWDTPWASSEQGFIQNTNMGPSADTGYWSQTTHNDVHSTAISPFVNEVTMNFVPDGTGPGPVQYSAPDTNLLTFDSAIGYHYDATTGLYYDANSGYFFNSNLRIFLQWDCFTQTYVRVENPLIPFPVLQNQEYSLENQKNTACTELIEQNFLIKLEQDETNRDELPRSRRRSRSGSRGQDSSRSGSRKRRASHSQIGEQREHQRGCRSPTFRTSPGGTSRSLKNPQRSYDPITGKTQRRDKRSSSPSTKKHSVSSVSSTRNRDDRHRSPDSDRRRLPRSQQRRQTHSKSPPGLSKKHSPSPGSSSRRNNSQNRGRSCDNNRRRASQSPLQRSPLRESLIERREERQSHFDTHSSIESKKHKQTEYVEENEEDSDEGMTEELLESILTNDDGGSGPINESFTKDDCLEVAWVDEYNNDLRTISKKMPDNRVPGDTGPFSDLYDSNPSSLVHVKSPTQGFKGNVIKESILHHLSTNDVEYVKIRVKHMSTYGSPFEYIEVVFKSSNQAEEWFLKTNRRITLQATQEVEADYFLYYASECWSCKNCGKVRNMFFRSLCHLCYGHKSGSFTPVRFSDVPTRFLGFCKLPSSTNESNFMQHLPQIKCNWQKCNFKSVCVIKDPGMNCCCGVVIVEMTSVEDAMHIQLIASRSPKVLRNVRYIEQDCDNRSGNRVPGDTDPFSNLYKKNPSRLVHVKPSSIQDFSGNVIKESIRLNLSANNIKCEEILAIQINDHGSPFGYIQVRFGSINQAEEWFMKTKRKITLQRTKKLEILRTDYFLYYAGEPWNCKNCGKGWNVFFRSLCHRCYCHKSGSFTSVRFSVFPTRFLGFYKLPSSTNESNCLQHLPQIVKKCNFKTVRVIEDTDMNCCCGVVIVEMTNVEEAMHIKRKASRSPQVLSYVRYIEQNDVELFETSGEIQPSLKELISGAESSGNRVPGDTDPFSNLYKSNPSHVVHVKPSSIEGFRGHVIAESIQLNLSTHNIKCAEILGVQINDHGNPFEYIQVRFESINQAEKWFMKTNRKITLQGTASLKLIRTDYFLYYAGESWNCKSCRGWNVFFRSLCHLCYCHKSGSFTSIRFSHTPTAFLGFCKLPHSTDASNFLRHLPRFMKKCDFFSVRVVEDPDMNCCCGVVVVEMPSIEEAMRIRQMTSQSSQVPSYVGYVEPDTAGEIHFSLRTLFGTAESPSGNRVPGDTDPFSDVYTSNPTCFVHIKSSFQSLNAGIVKASLQLHLLTNVIEYAKISVTQINNLGNPFEYIEVVFKSSNQAEEWFLKTNRKITLQPTQEVEADYFMYYAEDSWFCENCSKGKNAFFRFLCRFCYFDKSGSFTPVTFSDVPTRFLGFCKIPPSIIASNVMRHLPNKIKKTNFKSVHAVEDPTVNCCCGVVIVEMSSTQEATNYYAIHQMTNVHPEFLKYVDLDNSDVTLHRRLL